MIGRSDIPVQAVRVLITVFLLVCIGTGHYFLYTTPIEDFRRTLGIPLAASLGCLGLFGALSLALQSKGVRLRKICAFQIGMVALAGFATMAVHLFFPSTSPKKSMLSPAVMIYGNAYAFLFVLYPLELMRPGWLSIRRALLLFMPAAAMGLIYFAVVRMQNTAIHEIYQWSDLTANFRKFDVWFRATILVYPVWLFGRTLRYKIAYDKWCENNCSSKENKSLELLNNYNVGFLSILVSYLILLIVDHSQCRALHGLLFLVFIGYLLYQNFFNILPVVDQSRSLFYAEKEPVESETHSENKNTAMEQHSFTSKIPQYKCILEKWIQTDKPYKNPGFKLLDCMSVLPLNRSYLSRLFNEGYNETFFAFVMRHRIDESVTLMERYPDLTIACISEMCGFSSPSVFGRAFLKHKGVTPLQYRRKCSLQNEAC